MKKPQNTLVTICHRIEERLKKNRHKVQEANQEKKNRQKPQYRSIKGKGAFWDHSMLQQTILMLIDEGELSRDLLHATSALVPAGFSKDGLTDYLESSHRSLPLALPKFLTIKDLKRLNGLLYIPGASPHCATKAEKVARQASEFKAIRWALIRGQPILAVCGGALRLYNYLVSVNLLKSQVKTSVKVTGHSCRNGMPRATREASSSNDKVIRVVNNIRAHYLEVIPKSLVAHCIEYTNSKNCSSNEMDSCKSKEAVNSIHNKAPDEKHLKSSGMWVTARAGEASPQVKEYRSKLPQKGIAEALEMATSSHAPILATMWHPEAEPKSMLMKYFVLAGHQFNLKQKLLAELKKGEIILKNVDYSLANKFVFNLSSLDHNLPDTELPKMCT